MIQSAEDIKAEADRLEELHRKIAAEPVPPNSKAAAEAMSAAKVQFTFHRRFALHSLTFDFIE